MTDRTEPQRILTAAIEKYNPVALVSLFSGGYDSAVTTHLLHQLDTHGLPIQVWAIDTKLAADGWHEYVRSVADRYGWDFRIYDNTKGYGQFVKSVKGYGCPRTRKNHVLVYRFLKERGFDAIHMMNKTKHTDKTLFVSGVRKVESAERKKTVEEYHKAEGTNKCFGAPICNWSNEDTDYYRIENGLPDNPFYDTVKGSGDCQCNWGNFITLRMLQKHSPELAAGNVATLNNTSNEFHGYGWDGKAEGQTEAFDDFVDTSELTSPFLCAGCSRAKVRVPSHTIEQRYLQTGF